MARQRPANKSRPALVKVRVTTALKRDLRRVAAERDVPLSRLCYEALKALVAERTVEAA